MNERMDSELAFMSARELARLVRYRKIGCVELLDQFIGRIEQLDRKINAIVVRNFEAARTRARYLDDLPPRADLRHAPLAGVPITVKESFDLRGHPTTWGLMEHAGHRATRHAHAVERLISNGANVLGKTNVPTLLADWQTFNPLYGTTNNPWDLSRSPGGSSGGAAAALAAGMSALDIGSDIGASIRNPAHYCGVFGHKPTWGVCSTRGHSLPGYFAPSDISVIGPLARNADDLNLALSIIAGPEDSRAAGRAISLPKPRHKRLRDYRVAVLKTSSTAPVDSSVQRAVEGVADFLRQEGATVSDDARPAIDLDENHETYIMLLRAATAGRLGEQVFAQMQRDAALVSTDDKSYQAWLLRGATMSHRDWLAWNELRHRMRFAWRDFFENWDALLCPVAATEAFEHNQTGERWERMINVNGVLQPSTTQLFWAGYSGVCYLPSTVAPAGLGPSGLPVGVQIIGPEYGDYTTIDLAAKIETGYRRFCKPPLAGQVVWH